MSEKLFDYCLGNPPYQESSAGQKLMDKPVYHYFMDATYDVADKVELITPGRFLFNAGATPGEWNRKMLEDNHLKVLKYEADARKVFPSTIFKGGVAITYHDCSGNYGAIDTFTPYEELNSIKRKVYTSDGFQSIQDIIFIQNTFELEVLYTDHPEYTKIIGSDGKERRITSSIVRMLDVFTDKKISLNDICIKGIVNGKRVDKWINRKYVRDNGNLTLWKVIIPKNNGSGAIGEVLSTPLIGEPIIGEPLIGISQSFISLGAFDSRGEAECAMKYIKSKFSRALLGILKVTQNGSKNVYKYIPLQDFTPASDIDWSKSIHEIDLQLYQKYGLSVEEIKFIEEKVKEMT